MMEPVTISAAAYARLPAPVRTLFAENPDGSWTYAHPKMTICDCCGANTAVR